MHQKQWASCSFYRHASVCQHCVLRARRSPFREAGSFWMALAASAAGLVICCFIQDPSAPPANRGTIRVNQYIKDTLRLPKLKLFTILSMTAHAVLFITVFGFTPLYMNQLGMGDAELLWVMSAFFLPHAAATLSFVFLRFTSRIAYSVMLISFAVTGVCLLYVPF